MNRVIALTNESFSDEVLQSSSPVLVDFFATWCGPCKMMAPVIEALAEKYAGRLKVCQCDIDAAGLPAVQYRVMSVPTLILFQNGEAVTRLVGAMPTETLEAELKKYL